MLTRFFLFLFLTACILGGAVLWGTSHQYFGQPTFFLKTLIFLTFGTAVIYLYLYKAKRPDFFLQLYLLTMALKLLAYCAYVLVMVMQDKGGAVANVVFFMICYFIFTALEIGFLYARITGRKRP